MTTKCPICRSEQTREVISNACDHITGDVFRVLGCSSCGICFTYPVPDDMDNYYPSGYRGYGRITMGLLCAFYRLRVRKWTKMLDRPGKALEVGCGPGIMLEALHRKGWEVTGIERTEAMAEYARNVFGLNVISGQIKDLPKDQSFDLIILFNVLEHIQDPQTILKECATSLKPGGFLVINVPNIDSWQARFSGNLWLHLDPPRHLFHFTPKSLANILSMAGLKVYNVKFVSFEHDPFGWIQSTINKVIGHPNALTRYLMGIDGFNFCVLVSIVLGVLLVIPSVFLSMASWVMKKGALMQVTAIAPMTSNDTNAYDM